MGKSRRHPANSQPALCNDQANTPLSRLPESDWVALIDTLNGLLHLEFPSPFTDLEVLCPKEAWLVVELTCIHANASNFRQHLVRVLHALTRLLTHAETVRPWKVLHETFWRRVIASGMVAQQGGDGPDVEGFVRFVRAKGTHVALHWRGRSLDATQVIDPLKKWLHTVVDIPDACGYVPTHVALRFEDCRLTSKNLKHIHQLLRIPEDAGTKQYLCDPTTLRELSLSSNVLQGHLLHEVESILQDPLVRRVDGLKLDSTIPDEPYQTAAYTAAFHRTIAAVVNVKATRSAVEVEDRGVAVSFEDCSIFHESLVDALADALSQATRPLRGLSLACCYFPAWTVVERVGRLLVMHLPTATDDFDVDVSCIRPPTRAASGDRCMMDARASLLKDAALAAQAAHKTIECRQLHFNKGFLDGGDEIELSTTMYYPVRNVMDCGCCVIMVSPATANSEEVRCTVEEDGIANLFIDGQPVLRERSYGVIIDACKRSGVAHENCLSILTLADGLVARVARLSVRNQNLDWQEYVEGRRWHSWTLEPVEFNGQGCHDISTLTALDPDVFTSLQAIDLSRCPIRGGPSGRGVDTMGGPPAGARLRDVLAFPQLRALRFTHNVVDSADLTALHDSLVASRALAFVDIRETCVKATVMDDPHPDDQHVAIQTLLQRERLTTEALTTFHLAAQRLGPFPRDVMALILAFAGANLPHRVVIR